MGDFFYYGQKDVIRRLNELAGRGAVVASYAPAVGRSPLGGPNGYMSPAWLDPTIPIQTNAEIRTSNVISAGGAFANKYGYNFLQGGQALRMYKIATLAGNSDSTYASLKIEAMLGNWLGDQLSSVTIVMGSRDSTTGLAVDWSTSRFALSGVKFVAYKEANGDISVYLVFIAGSFAQAAFSLTGNQVTTYAAPVAVSTATGTGLWDSGAAVGSDLYRSPRSRGTGAAGNPEMRTGTSFDRMVEIRAHDGGSDAVSYIAGARAVNTSTAGADLEMVRLGVAGISGSSSSGYMNISISSGTGSTFKEGYRMTFKARDVGSGTQTNSLLTIGGNGVVNVPAVSTIGTLNTEAQGVLKLEVFNCLRANVVAGTYGSVAGSALNVATHSTTNVSIRTGGTVNTSGSDYAEYFWKCATCETVEKGQIIGINAENQLTDTWQGAIMFAVKSTRPSFVGGDTWAANVGERPESSAGAEPAKPLRLEKVADETPTSPYEEVEHPAFDTDEEWEAKLAAYEEALENWQHSEEADKAAMAEFDARLEAIRKRVDRIAIAGRVPVNVLGAQPGDYIVPVQDGAGIKGIAVQGDDLSMQQYLRAVGRVISIEADGRAYVMVKAV